MSDLSVGAGKDVLVCVDAVTEPGNLAGAVEMPIVDTSPRAKAA